MEEPSTPPSPNQNPKKKRGTNLKPNLPQMRGPKVPDNQPGCSRNFLWIAGILLVFAVLSLFANPYKKTPPSVSISDVSKKVAAGEVKKIEVMNDSDLEITLKKDDQIITSKIRSNDQLVDY